VTAMLSYEQVNVRDRSAIASNARITKPTILRALPSGAPNPRYSTTLCDAAPVSGAPCCSITDR
jgi:hypothetical protein